MKFKSIKLAVFNIHLLVIALLSTLSSHASSAGVLEVVLLRAEFGRLINVPQFSFCVCVREIAQNASSSDKMLAAAECECDHNLIASQTYDDALQLPLSCLSNPSASKCLVGVVYSSAAQYLYVRIKDKSSAAVTIPEWQSLPFHLNQKSIAWLATTSQHIKLIYTLQNRVSHLQPLKQNTILVKEKSDIDLFREKTPHADAYRTFWTKTRSWKSRKSSPLMPINLHSSSPPSPPQTISASTTPDNLIRQMGNDINTIRDFLLALALKQRIPPTSFDIVGFKRSVLNIGNRYRRDHNAVDLIYDSKCEAAAKRWADSLSSRRSCLIHEPVRRYGENMFFFASPHYFTDPMTMAEATMHSFYMEHSLYRYNSFNARGFFRYGHFTQMLWRASRLVGVGVAIGQYGPSRSGPCMPRSGSGHYIFVVLKYDPPGNVQKPVEYYENVHSYH